MYYDSKVRVVALYNLKAMCERASGVCHRYWVEKVSEHRVSVAYSNPDEYGSESPMIAVFPCWYIDGATHVALEMLRVQHDNWHGEGWQCFLPVLDCPELFRNEKKDWETREEIERRLGLANAP